MYILHICSCRFKNRCGCYLYGKMRRTDFLPVGEYEDEVLERGYDSVDSEDDEGHSIENAFAHRFNGAQEDAWLDVSEVPDVGNALLDVDFL